MKSMYHRKELRDFVEQDPVMRILKLKRIAKPKDPVTAPATLANRIDAAMELIRLLKVAGMIPGSFDADALFDLDLDVIQLPAAISAEDGSDTSSEPPRRMSLGPSGASMLEARSKIRRSSPARSSRRDNGSAPMDQATATESSDRSVGTLQKFFNATMDRYLAEEREANKIQLLHVHSIKDHKTSRWSSFDLPTMDLAGSSTMIQRVRISAISDLKVFTGKDQDENRARAWISKVKSAFMRDQASDDEKCLTFADLLAGSAKNWIFLAANEDVTPKVEKESANLDPRLPDRDHSHQDHNSKIHDHEVTPEIQRPSKISEYRRSTTMDLLPGESRGYWKHHSPDTCAEVSIVDPAFARKVGCYIDSSQIQDCVGIGDNVYRTEGRTRIKVTLAGSLVYFFDIWVGDLTGQQAILGMDFMVPAGIRLDLAHGSICLPDEVRIQLSGRQQLYSDKAKSVNVGQYLRIQAGESVELPLRLRSSIHDKLTKYISITNIGDEVLILHQDQRIGIWRAGDHMPRIPGFISIGSRRYMEWQNLALEARTDVRSEETEVKIPLVPAVERPEYETPRAILQRPKATLIQCQKAEASQDQDISNCLPSDKSPSDKSPSDKSPSEIRPLDLASVASDESDLSSIADRDSVSHDVTVKEALEDSIK
ncbi:hypothetical protein PHMEG_00024396 [Phytophthora megakarya]|uniref:Eukaryotic/viral aspartic protease n=1 Tax=Phytophthora megakarya TaxID=4795 RepID=A0A225VG09_9STRA|nr:hypothetical protein PHMEG_00024396 [Phytophthora megakarya]